MRQPSQLFFSVLLLVFGPVFAKAAPVVDDPELRRKVGQLFLLGFSQKTYDSSLRKLMTELQPGGLILFRRNLGSVEEIKKFTTQLKQASIKSTKAQPFLAVDQEGGSVVRIPVYPALPSAYVVGRTGRADLAKALGEETGRILNWCGFNMNLAPVLDLSDPSKRSFLASRSYGPDPENTGKIGSAFAEGLRLHGVLPTAKHFPGLGAVVADPHKVTIDRTGLTPDALVQEMEPFRLYGRLGENSALMVSQLSYPDLDPSGVPAPFSDKIMKGLLRDSLGYPGLVITDDLQMKGSSLVFPAEEAALKSLMAGADIVMISWSLETQRKAIQRVIKAVANGEWPMAELNARYERIMRVKKSLTKDSKTIMKMGKGPDGNPATKRMESLDLKILDANLKASMLRMPAEDISGPTKTSCVVSSQQQFIDSFRKGSKRKTKFLKISPVTTAVEMNARLKTCEEVIFAVHGFKTTKILSGLSKVLRRRTILVNLSLPFETANLGGFKQSLDLGFPHAHAGFRIAQAIERRRPASEVTTLTK